MNWKWHQSNYGDNLWKENVRWFGRRCWFRAELALNKTLQGDHRQQFFLDYIEVQ